jgi:antirestriction protein ArdC
MSKHSARARSGSDRASLYDEITAKIIAELEAGRVPWVQPYAPPSSASSCLERRSRSSLRRG